MKHTILAAAVLVFAFQAYAQETTTDASAESKAKLSDVKEANKVEGNIDEEITNKKLRAESGSKSKFSLSLDATFTGGSVEKPLDAKRPDLYGRPGTQRVSSLTLGPDVRYRWTKNDSVTFGTNIGVSTPLQGDINPQRGQTRVGDPALGYSRVGKLSALQSILSVGASAGTSPEALDVDRIADLAASWTLMRTWENGLSLGLSATLYEPFYSNASGRGGETGYGQDDRSDYEIGLYPAMEYEFNDVFSFRTVARYSSWYHYYGDPQTGRLIPLAGTQSAGIGISLGRDFYLYPNVQFDWAEMMGNRTNVAMTATINVF
jgi:hypothetical protein